MRKFCVLRRYFKLFCEKTKYLKKKSKKIQQLKIETFICVIEITKVKKKTVRWKSEIFGFFDKQKTGNKKNTNKMILPARRQLHSPTKPNSHPITAQTPPQSPPQPNSLHQYNATTLELIQRKFGKLTETGSPLVFCSLLPEHWRSNKALQMPFVVVACDEFIVDGTDVIITAGNDENNSAEMKNNHAQIKDGIAIFNDLRFIGKSGRGKSFTVTIAVGNHMAVLSKAIKVTVDGPREPRCKQSTYLFTKKKWKLIFQDV